MAIAYDGADFKVYKNGAHTGTTTTGIGVPASLKVSIGNFRENAGFVGAMDDIRIYNGRVLDADQIKFLYDTTLAT